MKTFQDSEATPVNVTKLTHVHSFALANVFTNSMFTLQSKKISIVFMWEMTQYRL